MIQRLEMKNFTAFGTLEMDFSRGVNLFIGENGTGKTHILKILYTVLAAQHERKRISDKIASVFLPDERRIGRLVKRVKGSSRASVLVVKKGKRLRLSFSNHTRETLKLRNEWNETGAKPCVYIPVKEMLANAPGFQALYNNREIHFEEVYSDIVSKAFIPKLRGPMSKDRRNLLATLERLIEGKIVSRRDQFYLRNKEGDLEFTLLAEGMRKLGLLWLLIQNGTLLEGATLFWDEPETNLNPSMFRAVAEMLLQLQRAGVQMFIATHNYVLLKEFDLQKQERDHVLFFSLSREKDTGRIICRRGKQYSDIVPNKISEAYQEIYDEEVRRTLGGPLK